MKNNKLVYFWNRIIKKLPASAVRGSYFEEPSRAEARSTILNTCFGRYSYCGYCCILINCDVGNFVSIGDNVCVGLAHHPQQWVSTSPAFYLGKDSIPKDLARLEYDTSSIRTEIGSDVWIGTSSMIKDGVKIGVGAIVGMGSVVTKDVPPYAIVAGNPARVIRYRFDEDIIQKLLASEWWKKDRDTIKRIARHVDDPMTFLDKLEEMK